jgi:hypothetical protein
MSHTTEDMGTTRATVSVRFAPWVSPSSDSQPRPYRSDNAPASETAPSTQFDKEPTIEALDVTRVCARSAYFRALLGGAFSESAVVAAHVPAVDNDDLRRPDPVKVSAPLPDGMAIRVIQGVLEGTARPSPSDALLLWECLAFLEAEPCLAECAAALHGALAAFWMRECDADPRMPDPYTVIGAYALRLVAASDCEARASMIADPSGALFDPESVWHRRCDSCFLSDDDDAPRDGTCVAHPRRVAGYAAYGPELRDAARRCLGAGEGHPPAPWAHALGWLERGRPGLMAAAAACAMRDWYAPLDPARPYVGAHIPASLCRVFDDGRGFVARLPAGGASDTTVEPKHDRDDPIEEIVPCFVSSQEDFVGALTNWFPRAMPAIVRSGILGEGVVMAGGAVVAAMQSPALRATMGPSPPCTDIDLWIVGESQEARRAAMGRTVHALIEALPGCRARLNGPVVTLAVPPSDGPNDGTRATCDDDDDDGKGKERDATADAAIDPCRGEEEVVQIIFGDYSSGHDVVADFDLTHSCAYYDGSSVYATRACVWSMVSRTTSAVPCVSPTPARVAKASARGFAYDDTDDDPDNSDDDKDGNADASRRTVSTIRASLSAAPSARIRSDAENVDACDEGARTKRRKTADDDDDILWHPYRTRHVASAADDGGQERDAWMSTAHEILSAFCFEPLDSNVREGQMTGEAIASDDPHYRLYPFDAPIRVRLPPLSVVHRCWCRVDGSRGGRRVFDPSQHNTCVALGVQDAPGERAVALGMIAAAVQRMGTIDASCRERERVGRTAGYDQGWWRVSGMAREHVTGPVVRIKHRAGTDDVHDAITGSRIEHDDIPRRSYVAARAVVVGVALTPVCVTPVDRWYAVRVYPESVWTVVAAIIKSISCAAERQHAE